MDPLPKAIRNHLINVPDIEFAVGPRIHYQVIPKESTYPHIWFTRSSRDPDDLLDGDGLVFHRFKVEIVAQDDAGDLAEHVFNALHLNDGPIDSVEIDSAFMEDADDSYLFRSVADDALFLKAFELLVITE